MKTKNEYFKTFGNSVCVPDYHQEYSNRPDIIYKMVSHNKTMIDLKNIKIYLIDIFLNIQIITIDTLQDTEKNKETNNGQLIKLKPIDH